MKYRAHLLPRTDTLYVSEDTSVKLDGDKFDILADSIAEFVTAVQPNVLIEHEVDGSSYGKVLQTYTEDSGLYAILEIDEECLPENFSLRWVSPRIAWNHVDVTGRKWPAALLETSLVSVPRFLVGQENLMEVSLSSTLEMFTGTAILNSSEIYFAEPLTSTTTTPTTEDQMNREEIEMLVKELLAANAQTMAMAKEGDSEMYQGPKSMMAADADPISLEIETVDEAMGYGMKLSEDVTAIEDVDAYVNGLSPEDAKSQLVALIHSAKAAADESLLSEVKAELACRKISMEKAGDFFKLAKGDRKTFHSAMSAIPRVTLRETPTRTAGLSRNPAANTDPASAALAASRRGEGSFTDLLAKYRKELI